MCVSKIEAQGSQVQPSEEPKAMDAYECTGGVREKGYGLIG